MKALLQALIMGGHRIKRLGRANEPDDAVPWIQTYQSKSVTFAPPMNGDVVTLCTLNGNIEVVDLRVSLISTTGLGFLNYTIAAFESSDRTVIQALIVEDTDVEGGVDGGLQVAYPFEAVVPDASAIMIFINNPINVKEVNFTLNYRML